MDNKEAIEKLKEIMFMTGYKEAISLAIKALEESQLDIKSLKMDLPELFRWSCDGGYLRGE